MHKSGKTTVGRNMPTLYYAHAFDHICNLIIFVTCNAFYINERTDMDSRVELVESLHPITASLWSWYIFLLMEGRRMQRRHAMPRVVQGLSWRQEPFKRESLHDLQCEWTCWVHELVLADRVCSVGKPCNVSHNSCCKESESLFA